MENDDDCRDGDDMELTWNILNNEMSKIYFENVNLRSKSHKIDFFWPKI